MHEEKLNVRGEISLTEGTVSLKMFVILPVRYNQIWLLFLDARSNKIERHENVFTCIEPVRHLYFLDSK